ncbi:hypothetical protein [Stenotrophomonas maltophilia]|uniref:hypothetical protein n=1 Tax=Stenotrophomonas TaxID=40323 RepID=UPI000AD92F92|nr:hypothetical protein [Stenotrophomonas maltophilia]MBA0224135.1 hypothetical protein [Stenotrophomonas maltophilia]MBA0364945.1 hypothetical protein [Stenotrophomonas maltophilia]MBA0402486.1 hypothetical protein [Stenotrophomonas maltophilia]MCF3521090.1 hypothetical protein [Stenotrophomonas maltophilia]PSD17326.1 hypothetical protein C7E14_06725 [Stenotrophomonas maltophilia]
MENDADVVALLESWFQFAAEDALVIDPGCITAEARGNLCAFSPPPDTFLDVAPVVAFVHRVAAYRAAQVAGHAMTFYCWHDAMVRQLRLSLVSSQHGHLPFGCHHVATTDVRSIVQAIVVDDWNNPRCLCLEDRDGIDAAGANADGPMYTEERPLRVAVIPLG